VRNAGLALKKIGHGVHLTRIENTAGEGTPDVEGFIDTDQVWIELKSEPRPARPTTTIRPKVRQAQAIWLRERVEAGCKRAFVLLQVGEGKEARLYLIPGHRYDEITTTEDKLREMSIMHPTRAMPFVLMMAKRGW
jgi:hypothetical protein